MCVQGKCTLNFWIFVYGDWIKGFRESNVLFTNEKVKARKSNDSPMVSELSSGRASWEPMQSTLPPVPETYLSYSQLGTWQAAAGEHSPEMSVSNQLPKFTCHLWGPLIRDIILLNYHKRSTPCGLKASGHCLVHRLHPDKGMLTWALWLWTCPLLSLCHRDGHGYLGLIIGSELKLAWYWLLTP